MSGRDLLIEFQRSTGATQTQLAGRFNVTAAYVSFLLSGDRIPGLGVAYRIEKATAGAVPASAWLRDLSERPPVVKRKATKRAVRRVAGRSPRRST